MKTIGIAIARMGSSRLPGKVLKDLGGKPVLWWVTRALKWTPSIDEVWVATTIEKRDDQITEWCFENDISFYRGSENDVLARVYGCAVDAKADIVVRVTSDCPLLDPSVIEQVIQLRAMTDADYASNVDPPTYADGLDTEAFTFAALESAHNEAVRPSDRDCVTRYIARNRDRWRAETLINPIPGGHKERFVLDTESDLRLCQEIVQRLPNHWNMSHLGVIRILNNEPGLRDLNSHHPRNERFYEQVATEDRPEPKFDRSNAYLKRAREVIPLGSQTFSKSWIQYPFGQAPLFLTHGDGGYVYDVDGNDLVDMVCGLLPVILGYADPDVDEAIRRQLTNGISFSTNTALETELAELLCRLVPCAEMCRFGKNGTDVTTAAVRLARAYTGREFVLLSGYHGWADWSMGTTERNIGIPPQPSAAFPYGDRSSIRNYNYEKAAAIIVEPTDNPEFLRWLRQYCDNFGIVLIFDEIITGFRYPGFSAQKHFGVTPDLATFGKAMGNGMPINAVVGKREIMKLMEPPDCIFYSGTFMSETLSLAAAIACIKKLERENVPERLAENGMALADEVIRTFHSYGLETAISLSGHPTYKKVNFHNTSTATADQIKTLFIREMIRNGVLIIATHNLCHAHGAPELKRVVQAWERTSEVISDAIRHGTIDKALGDTPLIGQVSVRSYGVSNSPNNQRNSAA